MVALQKSNKENQNSNNNKNLQTICNDNHFLQKPILLKNFVSECFSLIEPPDQFSEKDLPAQVTTGLKYMFWSLQLL